MTSTKTLLIKAKAYQDIIEYCNQNLNEIGQEMTSNLMKKFQKETTK